MRPFPCAHATHPQWPMAAALVLTQLRAQLAVPAPGSHPGDPASPDEQPVPGLGVVYFTDHYAAHAQDLLDHLMAALPEVTDWVGTVGVGIAASGVEYFNEPALAVMLLDVPPDQYRVFSGVAPLPAALPSAVTPACGMRDSRLNRRPHSCWRSAARNSSGAITLTGNERVLRKAIEAAGSASRAWSTRRAISNCMASRGEPT